MGSGAAVAVVVAAYFTAAALSPIPELAFVLQIGTAGAAVGTCVGLLRVERDPGYRVQILLLRWTVLGLIAGVLAVVVYAMA